MYKLKQINSDFIVNEDSNVKILDKGKYTYFVMKKENYNTLRAIEHVAKALRFNAKKIGFAGNKDKNAITTQICSVLGLDQVAIERITLKDISLEYLGKGDSPISLGDLEGNSFEIIVRNIDSLPTLKKEFINYFGEQRFSKNNADVGKAIVFKDFKKAVSLILENSGDNEKKIKQYLELKKNKNDYVGALKTIPLRLLRLYVHAYQSLLWNKSVELLNKEEQDIPIIGFGTVALHSVIDKIIQKEKLKMRDFIIKEIPVLSSEGGIRAAVVTAENVSIGKLEEDELNIGKKKVLVKFKLPKGSYATEFVKNLFQ